jgi:hypothetical protein
MLRNLRDNMALKTRAGTAFLTAFNAWYYSFSPAVAQQIGKNSALRGIMEVTLYPAIAILSVASLPFALLPSHGELAAVISGFVMSLSLGATYLGIPTAILLRFSSSFRRRTRALTKTAILFVIGSFVVVTAGEVTSLAALMTAGTSALVLSTMGLGAVGSSQMIIRLKTLGRIFS